MASLWYANTRSSHNITSQNLSTPFRTTGARSIKSRVLYFPYSWHWFLVPVMVLVPRISVSYHLKSTYQVSVLEGHNSYQVSYMYQVLPVQVLYNKKLKSILSDRRLAISNPARAQSRARSQLLTLTARQPQMGLNIGYCGIVLLCRRPSFLAC